MSPNSHFKELLNALNRCEAKYLVVGGYAVMLYTEPRYTKRSGYMDRSQRAECQASVQSPGRIWSAPRGRPPAGFMQSDLIYQLGVPPSRIDVLTSISGVRFEDAWTRKRDAEFGDVTAAFISPEDLLRNKRATGRTTDLSDCERLQQLKT